MRHQEGHRRLGAAGYSSVMVPCDATVIQTFAVENKQEWADQVDHSKKEIPLAWIMEEAASL